MPHIEKLQKNAGKSHVQQHHWAMLVVRYKYRSTLKTASDLVDNSAKDTNVDVFKILEDGEVSPQEMASLLPVRQGIGDNAYGDRRARVGREAANVEREQEGTLVLSDEVSSWSVDSQRSQMIGTANFSLLPTRNWVRDIAGGDWVMFWAVDNTGDWNKLVKKLLAREPCNTPEDGLKFVGRVKTVSRVESVTQNGNVTVNYNILAKSFSEFEHELKYHPSLSTVFRAAGVGYLAEIFGTLPDQTETTIPNQPSKCLDAIITQLFGEGLFSESKFLKGDIPATVKTTFPMLIPPTIQKLMGAEKPSFGSLLVYDNGVQDFDGQYNSVKNDPLAGYTPLLGYDFNNRSYTDILRDFLNAPINEMFVSLRLWKDGKIRPYLCLRQAPFSSNAMQVFGRPVTPCLSLPRWDITELYERYEYKTDYDMKFNWFHLPTRNLSISSEFADVDLARQLNECPPVLDVASIQRDGVRAYERQLIGNFVDTSPSLVKQASLPAPAATTNQGVSPDVLGDLSQDMLGRRQTTKLNDAKDFGDRPDPVMFKYRKILMEEFALDRSIADQIVGNIQDKVGGFPAGSDIRAAGAEAQGKTLDQVKVLFPGNKVGVQRENHPGVDLSAGVGDPVYAVRDGRIGYRGESTMDLTTAEGYRFSMLHLSERVAAQGALVKAGDLIAKAGNAGVRSTGAHLHVELRLPTDTKNPVDPLLFYDSVPGNRPGKTAAPASISQPSVPATPTAGFTSNQWGQMLLSDFMLDQHLRGQGGATLAYIQKPITIGDVCQVRDEVGMIEQVNHSGRIFPDGRKVASTTLALSNIVKLDPNRPNEFTYIVDDQDRPVSEGLSNASVLRNG